MAIVVVRGVVVVGVGVIMRGILMLTGMVMKGREGKEGTCSVTKAWLWWWLWW